MLFVQEKLSKQVSYIVHCTLVEVIILSNLLPNPKYNHMIERLWVEDNTRVNYPIKKVLIEMENVDVIHMADSLCK